MTTLPVPYWRSDCGRHTLYHGDCLAILPHLSGVDCVVTDPPYGIGYEPSRYRNAVFSKIIHGDDSAFDPSIILSLGVDCLVWGGNNFADKLPRGGWLCWDKRTNEDADKILGSPFEMAWTTRETTFKMLRCMHGGVVNADGNTARVHPTQKPIRVMIWCLGFVKGETVLDPFAGSGTTGVACAMTGRRFIGIEIDEGYCAIAKRRIEEAANHLFVPTETNPPDDDPPLFDPATEAA